MLPIKKFIIGIRPARKMFRVRSTWGDIADAVLDALDDKHLGSDYYTKIGTNDARDALSMSNPDTGNVLRVDFNNVVFSVNTYGAEHRVNTGKAFEQFEVLWRVVNAKLKMTDVRRIGIAGESRLYDIDDPSKVLAEALTKIPATQFTANFHQVFEERTPVKTTGKPDFAKGHFMNRILTFYESTMDADFSEDDCINANFDYQHYYSPLLTRNVVGEAKIHFRDFEKRWKTFADEVKNLGLID